MPGTVPQRADVPASPPVEMIRGSKLSPLANPLPRHDGVRGSRPGTVPVGTVRPCRTFPGFVTTGWRASRHVSPNPLAASTLLPSPGEEADANLGAIRSPWSRGP